MSESKKGYVYILFNRRNGTLYAEVTSDLIKWVHEHKEKLIEGFSKKYGIDKLGYYEEFETVIEAIKREKHIKSKSRKYKMDLIEKTNSAWQDLYYTLV